MGGTPERVALPGSDADHVALRFPDVFEPNAVIGGVQHFSARPNLVAWVRGLGFDWTPAGRVLSVPTPVTLCRMLDRLGPSGRGYRPELCAEDELVLPIGRWIRAYLD